jgi:hypothetical protein
MPAATFGVFGTYFPVISSPQALQNDRASLKDKVGEHTIT